MGLRLLKSEITLLFLFSLLPLSANAFNKNIDLTCKKSFLKNKTPNYCLDKDNNSYSENYIAINFDNKFSEFLEIKKYDILAEIPLIQNNEVKKNKFFVEIISDLKIDTNDLFTAEGNVKMATKNGTLYADKITFNRKTDTFNAYGNVIIIRGNQYLESNFFEYDYKNEKGIIKNVYGGMDISSFSKDLDLNQKVKKTDIEIYNQKLKSLMLTNESNIGLSDSYRKDRSLKLELSLSDVAKWRFKSEEITFTASSFNSKEIFFTNDPFNEPQFLIQSKDFSGESIKGKLKMNSKSSFLILDNKLRIPIGNRTVYDRDPITKWGLGSDYSEKDGIYVYRGFNSVELNKNFSLQITPYFLIQRALKGDTKAFVHKNESIFSEKKKQDINLSDYFAADIKITGEINDWDIIFENNLNSLNLNRDHDLLRSKFSLKKKIYKKDINTLTPNYQLSDFTGYYFSEEIDLELYSAFRETVWRGLDGQEEIYFAYGTRLNNYNVWRENKTTYDTQINLGISSFRAKNISKNLITRQRVALNGSYGTRSEIWSPNNLDDKIDQNYKYSPNVIYQGIFLNKELSFALFEYSEGSSQQAVVFKLGPEFIFGEKKKKFLDYSRFKGEYTYTLRSGQSPFVFDSINKSAYANFEFYQQIYGPLKFKYKTTLNLDGESIDYGKLSNHRYELSFNRRAYLVSAFLEPGEERFGLDFKIFNFGYTGMDKKF